MINAFRQRKGAQERWLMIEVTMMMMMMTMIIIIIMFTCTTTTDFYRAIFKFHYQSASQCIITRVLGFTFSPALTVHLLHSLSILASCHHLHVYMGTHNANSTIIFPSYWVSNYTWVECRYVDEMSC